jgi:hypothetical protein
MQWFLDHDEHGELRLHTAGTWELGCGHQVHPGGGAEHATHGVQKEGHIPGEKQAVMLHYGPVLWSTAQAHPCSTGYCQCAAHAD